MTQPNRTSFKRKHKQFIATVWTYYHAHHRTALPWRNTQDPYRIVVSELMLQQTQVARVIPKYQAFLRRFPTTKQLATSSLAEVLRYWQGLGYNRRAKSLHECVRTVHTTCRGRWPRTIIELQALPGIGSYTAAAIVSFAYNEPTVCIETNIRTSVIHHYFPTDDGVSDSAIASVLAETVSTTNPREWYWALMDYGSFVKRTHRNYNRQTKSYRNQSSFTGSDRQIRGTVIRALTERSSATFDEFEQMGFALERVRSQCQILCKEGLIESINATTYRLRS